MKSTDKQASSSSSRPPRIKHTATKPKAKDSKATTKKSKKSTKEPVAPFFDTHRFKSLAHSEAFSSKFSTRAVLVERRFELTPELYKVENGEELQNHPICEAVCKEIQGRKWGLLAKMNFPAYQDIVVEFYANLKIGDDEEFYSSYVRGKHVSFSPRTINALLLIPFSESRHCAFEHRASLRVEPSDVEGVLCDGKGVWKESGWHNNGVRHLNTPSLCLKAKIWWTFVHGILLPIQHKTTITKKRLWCLYTLMNQEYLNVGLTIANEIHALHKQNKGSLSYAGIITQLCINAGVSCEGLIPMKSGSLIDLDSTLGVTKVKSTPTATTSHTTTPNVVSKNKAPMASTSHAPSTSNASSSSKQDKILRHLRVVHENIRRVHEHTKVCVMLEPLLRVVASELDLPVEKLVPVEAFNKDFIDDLMKFDEFSEDEGELPRNDEDNDDE